MTTLRNRVQLIGKLGFDPELLEFNNSKKVKFSMATNEIYYQDGNKREETQWHNIIAWGKLAENVKKYLVKGNEVAITGKLTSRSYNDKEGTKKYITEIVMSDMVMLSSNKNDD